ncbi:MAG: A/G-specific adenine glycosylase [Candidatus Parcubacteria bacterium]|nr:A/G-specific adenine glycosylase [Candidatus Parcubacteria bacterium]
MLQQTQVERVIPFYKNFIKQFPTAKKLAAVSLSEVLKSWQGLGYNRRAKMLHQAAKSLAVARLNLATKSNLVSELEKLPGVGPYTARAVAAFAYNEDVVFVETNIRTAIIHHFFPKKKKVSDKEIEKILIQALPRRKSLLRQGSAGRAREWYSALMDYGAYLKRSGISYNTRSKKYVKQQKFSGSLREARGAILREFTKGVTSRTRLVNIFGPSRRVQMKEALEALIAEGLVSPVRDVH